MRSMDQAATYRQESTDMNETNVRQFLEATRQYLLGLIPAQPAPAMTSVTARGGLR
jgi:hypothetical protein